VSINLVKTTKILNNARTAWSMIASRCCILLPFLPIKVWKEIASGAKQERAERKKVLALARARKVGDPRHRTDPLGPLGQVRRAVLNVL
jgi:hypothetical protein